MNTRLVSTVVTMASLVFAFHVSNPSTAEAAEKKTGKRWIDMDYGPYKATTIEAPLNSGNFAYKGIAIKVGGNENASICFDTDTLRYSAGWNKGWLNLNGVVYDGKHWAYPNTNGPIQFSNPVMPGWGKPGASTDNFKEPRFIGNDKKPYGPMPRDWAQWKGLYVHGDNVVLSYKVGTSNILELPGMEQAGDLNIFTRTLNIDATSKSLEVQLASEAKLKPRIPNTANLKTASSNAWAKNSILIFDAKDSDEVLAIGFVGSARAKWHAVDNHARIVLAAGQKQVKAKLLLWRGNASKLPDFTKAVLASKAPADLTPLTKGGPARWGKTIETQAKLGKPKGDAPYAIDTITWPDDNPWGAWMRFGGFDFFADGKSAAIGTWSGDVWIVEGIQPDGSMGKLKWRRIASGLFQALGIKIIKGEIFVTCRDQITRLHDLNGDGETDFYEAFKHDHQVTEHFHEFAMDLQTDEDGNFYYAKSARHARDSLVEHHGTLLKVSPDGKKTTIVANGYRAANGVGVGPKGKFFTSDQEGHWMPANRINLVKPGSFSGNMYSYHRSEKPTDYDRPITWLPKSIDRSPAEQIWVTSDKWGLPKDSLLSLSYGTGFIQNVMFEEVPGLNPRVYVQGAFHRLPLQFPTGIMRGRFHKTDGQLYTCGLFGWSSNQRLPGGFYRIRYTGKPITVPVKFLVAKDGIVLEFNDPIDDEIGADVESYLVEQWDYKWSKNYGSPEYKLSGGKRGRDTTAVKAAYVSKDKKRIWLEIPGLKASMQVRVKYDLDTAKGKEIGNDIYGSIHVIPNRSGKDLLAK
jgi:hypothetical protein